MSSDAVRFDLALKKGDAWDEARARAEFRRFWDRGLFSDLRFFRRCDPDGAVLVIELKERPTLLSITYEKNKVVSQQQVEDHFKERSFKLLAGQPLDRKKLFRAEALIEELLGAKGFLDSNVSAEVKEISTTARSVTFRINPGSKTRIRSLDFVGNQSFKDRELVAQLKLVRPRRWWWPFGQKSLYHPLKLSQDLANVAEFYRNRGHLDVELKPTVTEFRAIAQDDAERKAARRTERLRRKAERERQKATERGEIPDEQPLPTVDPDTLVKRSVTLTVPIDEGPVYRLGEVRFEGSTVFEADKLRRMMPIKQGDVLADGLVELGLSQIRNQYGEKGYVYAAVTRRFERKTDESVADLVVAIDEDRAYSVRRIDFLGNTLTQDEVLRREMLIYEGEVVDKRGLNISVDKLRQLGYWQPTSEAELVPTPGEASVDVRIHGEEQSRNEIQVGGGYSELDGAFFLASYSTRNFLGRGDTLSVYAQVGGRADRASISFVEPWFFGKPYTFGFSIFRRDLNFGRTVDASGDLGRLRQRATGGSISLGKYVGSFARAQLEYQYQSISADTFDISRNFDTTRTRIATITPSYWYRYVRPDFYRPTRGLDYRFSLPIATDVLGGEVNYIRPRAEVTYYKPLFGKFFMAAHVEASWIRPFGETVREPGFVDGVPRFDRFFLGGDTLGPRVFETRSISPIEFRVSVDDNGNVGGAPVPVFVGGTKMGLAQFEFAYPVGKTATFASFLDIGGVYPAGVDFNWNDARVSAGVEFRVFLPVFQAPIRLIYGWPLREQAGDRVNNFQFSIGLPF
jgi:outer membrane protein insertion porin family